jgi:precorrin-6x reductase
LYTVHFTAIMRCLILSLLIAAAATAAAAAAAAASSSSSGSQSSASVDAKLLALLKQAEKHLVVDATHRSTSRANSNAGQSSAEKSYCDSQMLTCHCEVL